MVKIISDSTCDLTPDLLQQYNISIIPLHILMGDAEYEDGNGITQKEIFAWADQNKTTPKTSAPSMDRVIEILRPYVEQKTAVICFSISSSMSASGNVMRLAAEELDAEDLVTVIDSANLSTGIGLLVIEAAIMSQNGMTANEIVNKIEELKPLVRSSFVVDTLTYLYRGGRCSGLAALAGSALRLHPKIAVENGAMSPGKKYRGKISKVIPAYVDDLTDALKNARPDRVFITHSLTDHTIVEQVHQTLSELNIFSEILETPAGGVISSHCGPGTLGVLFISKS